MDGVRSDKLDEGCDSSAQLVMLAKKGNCRGMGGWMDGWMRSDAIELVSRLPDSNP